MEHLSNQVSISNEINVYLNNTDKMILKKGVDSQGNVYIKAVDKNFSLGNIKDWFGRILGFENYQLETVVACIKDHKSEFDQIKLSNDKSINDFYELMNNKISPKHPDQQISLITDIGKQAGIISKESKKTQKLETKFVEESKKPISKEEQRAETKNRLILFYLDQEGRLSDLKQKLTSAAPEEKHKIQDAVLKIENSDIQKTKIALKVQLGQPASDEEVANYLGKSITTTRGIILGQVYKDIMIKEFPKILNMGVADQNKLLDQHKDFLNQKVCKQLGITRDKLNEWLDDLETERQINETLTRLGGEKVENLEDLGKLLNSMKAHQHLFDQPFHLVKLQNILNRLNQNANPTSEVQKWKEDCVDLIKQITGNMTIRRQHAITQMLTYQDGMKDVRSAVSQAIYHDLQTDLKKLDEDKSVLKSKLEYVEKEAQEQIIRLQTSLDSLSKQGDIKSEDIEQIYRSIPPSFKPIFLNVISGSLKENQLMFSEKPKKEDVIKGLSLTIQKLKNVQERQKNRLNALAKGEDVLMPQYFHATTGDAATSIAKTGIEAVMASSGFGAFLSTEPLFRYGSVVFGLPKEVETSSPQKTVYDKDSAPGVIKDTNQVWAGLRDLIAVNPRIRRLEANFSSAIEMSIKQRIDRCKNLTKEQKFELEARLLTYFNRSVVFRAELLEDKQQGFSLNFRDLGILDRQAFGKVNKINNNESLKKWVETMMNYALDDLNITSDERKLTKKTILEDFQSDFKQAYYYGQSSPPRNDFGIVGKPTERLKASVIASDDDPAIKDVYEREYNLKLKSKTDASTFRTLSYVKDQFIKEGLATKEGINDLVEFIPLSEQLLERDILLQVDAKVPKAWK